MRRISVALYALLFALVASATLADGYAPQGGKIPYLIQVARGHVPGHSPLVKFGDNPSIDAAEGFVTVWDGGGVYVPPSAARIHNIASTSAEDAGTIVAFGTATGGSLTSIEDSTATFGSVAVNDMVLNDSNVQLAVVTAVVSPTELTLARSMRSPEIGEDGLPNLPGDAYRVVRDASTGASILYISGLNAFFMTQTEFIVPNGLGDIATLKSYRRQNRARIFSPANPMAVGTITSTTIGETLETVSLQIINGNNQTMMTPYTIPIDKIGLLIRWWGSISKKQAATAIVILRVGQIDPNKPSYVTQPQSLSSTGTSSFNFPFPLPLFLPGGSDIWVETEVVGNEVGIASGFDFVLIQQ